MYKDYSRKWSRKNGSELKRPGGPFYISKDGCFNGRTILLNKVVAISIFKLLQKKKYNVSKIIIRILNAIIYSLDFLPITC